MFSYFVVFVSKKYTLATTTKHPGNLCVCQESIRLIYIHNTKITLTWILITCTCHQSAIQQSLSTTKEHTSPPFPVEPWTRKDPLTCSLCISELLFQKYFQFVPAVPPCVTHLFPSSWDSTPLLGVHVLHSLNCALIPHSSLPFSGREKKVILQYYSQSTCLCIWTYLQSNESLNKSCSEYF